MSVLVLVQGGCSGHRQVGGRLKVAQRFAPFCFPICCAPIIFALLLLLRSFPELLLLGRADCAQRVQVSVLVLVLGGCLGRRQRF